MPPERHLRSTPRPRTQGPRGLSPSHPRVGPPPRKGAADQVSSAVGEGEGRRHRRPSRRRHRVVGRAATAATDRAEPASSRCRPPGGEPDAARAAVSPLRPHSAPPPSQRRRARIWSAASSRRRSSQAGHPRRLVGQIGAAGPSSPAPRIVAADLLVPPRSSHEKAKRPRRRHPRSPRGLRRPPPATARGEWGDWGGGG